MGESAVALAGGFTALDWTVVAAILVATTIVGERMAGRQASMRDFFLGGRKLPWYAVSASIVATEISAVTYVSVPSVVFKPGGDFTYLQLGLIGSFLARVFVGYVLVPAYYEREIYSPYDYVGNRIGPHMRSVTTVLFSLGGVLGQAARVYVTAVVLEVILQRPFADLEAVTGLPPLWAAVGIIGLVAVLWTLIGGIATVIWTDAVLFLLFLIGIAVTLLTVAGQVDGGLGHAFAQGLEAGKLRLIDTSTDPTRAYTLWVALFAASWWMVGPFGTDQLMTQRLFCCRDAREARKAIIASSLAVGIAFLAMLVGVALWAFYREHPMQAAALAMVQDDPDRVFPIFITEVIPVGLKGLVVAGVFAAAISSLDSIMAALSQTTMSAFVLPRRKRWLARHGRSPDSLEEARRNVRLSRVLVLVWAVLLCGMAVVMDSVAERYDSILDLALAMATYTGGALLAAFFLAFLELRTDGSGFPWAAGLSVMTVFGLVWHEGWAQVVCGVYATGTLCAWFYVRSGRSPWRPPPLVPTLVLVLSALGVLLLSRYATFAGEGGEPRNLAFPWYVPIGSVVAFAGSLLLDRPLSGTEPRCSR